MRIFRLTYAFLLILALPFIFGGCIYDRFDEFGMEYGDGFANMQVQVEFKNLSPALDTRAAGNAIGPVSHLQMVIYRVANGTTTFHDRIVCNKLDDYNLSSQGNSAEPSDKQTGNDQHAGGQFESTGELTDHATFSIKDLPYGVYKIYAVANVPDLTDDQCQTEDDLKKIQFKWDPVTVGNNNAMFGYFTAAERPASSGFDAPLVLVNKPNVSIHSWIKRLASKVTVAFDPSELKEAVTVYIKSVTIHDIPETCCLGVDNKPGPNDTFLTGETIDYSNGSSDYTKWAISMQKGSKKKGSTHSNADDALFFFENKQGDFSQAPNKKDYLKEQIPDETGKSINEEGDNLYGGENAPADNDFKDRVKQGSYIEVIGYYVSKNSEKMSSGNIKYRFMLGKDIMYNYDAERNYHYKLTLKFRGFANEADWHIVYEEPTPSLYTPDKFYVSYLYGQESKFPVRVITGVDAEYTSQYILTAEIIENSWWPYDEDDEDDNDGVPPVTIGLGTDMKGFAWMKSAVYKIAEGTGVMATSNYTPYYTGDNKDYAGFLSLRKPEMKGNVYKDIEFEGEIEPEPGKDKSPDGENYRPSDKPLGYGPNHSTALKNYYFNKNVAHAAYYLMNGTRNVGLYNGSVTLTEGSSTDGQYTVSTDNDGSVTLKIPMYTRPLKMVAASDFTGNNPYPSFMRRAMVKFKLYDQNGKEVWFKDLADHDKLVNERIVPILQVRRVENPKAIYRAWNNNASFDVHLMHRRHHIGHAADKFEPFVSDGPWRASIMACTEDFVKLTGNGQTVTQKGQYIEGSSGTEIEFTYEPTGNCGQYATRCAIIKVEYHDYTCNHLIFVRQGYDKGVSLAGANWSLYQVYSAKLKGDYSTNPGDDPYDGVGKTALVKVTKSPLSIGSLMKRCQYNASIREADNPGWLENVTTLSTTYYDSDEPRNVDWGSISGSGWFNYGGSQDRYKREWADTWEANINGSTKKLKVPTWKNYEDLRDQCDFGFGIAYADDANETATSLDVAYGYIDKTNTGTINSNGMRVCVAYDPTNGNNILFPIGKEGHGRRPCGGAHAYSDIPSNSYGYKESRDPGVLSYGGLASVLWDKRSVHRPITYNHYRTPGAIYWVKVPKYVEGNGTASYGAWDINYFTLRFTNHDSGSIGNFNRNGANASTCSDALPMKLIYINSND